MDKVLGITKHVTAVFIGLFIIEIIFGYNGNMLAIRGVAICHILYAAVLLLSCLFCLLYICKNRIRIFSLKDKTSVLGMMSTFDWIFAAFTVYSAVSFLITPRLTGGSLLLARADAMDAVAMMALYFPLSFMFRWGQINTKKFGKLIYICLLLLSVLHIVLYIGQSINKDFIEGYFDLLYRLSFRTAVIPDIILGHMGYPRVIYVTSIFIMIGFYLAVRRLPKARWYDYAAMALHWTGLLTTMTKSIWLGLVAGFVVFGALYVIRQIREKNRDAIKKFIVILICGALLTVALDVAMFNGTVGSRIRHAFQTSFDEDEETDEEEDSLEYIEAAGSALSNAIKLEQTEKLVKRGLKRPLLGQGYGSYIKGYTRSRVAPFSYEMQLPALFMKTGTVGILFIIALVIELLRRIKRFSEVDKVGAYAWLMLAIAFGICVQTNPMLFSISGFAFVLYLIFVNVGFEMRYSKKEASAEGVE